jgi:CRISPR-associated protein Cmr1
MMSASTPDMLQALPADAQPSRSFILPDIRDFFFAKIQFSEPQNNANWWHSIQGIKQGLTCSVTDSSHTPPLTKNLRPISEDLHRLVDHQCIPLAPAVRNWLRFKWFPTRFRSGRAPAALEKYLFGYASNQGNQASKISVSHAYKVAPDTWEFRIWGWLPCQSPEGVRINRDQLLSDLRKTLNDAATWRWVFNGGVPQPGVSEWHQLDCGNRDGRGYLEKLLGLK